MAGAGSLSSVMMVRVKRELLASCMTCPICNKLLKDATTISECLHTFCRKCIFEKLNDEEVDCCPICNIDLGCAPVEKLRADHNLQDIRAKIFPLKRRKVSAPETLPSTPLPARRKERSLSSLVVDTPRVATQPSLTGRRTKGTARRVSSLRGLGPVIEEPKEEVKNADNRAENSSRNRRQIPSNVKPSDYTPNKNTENVKESAKDRSELWKPLNCLVEAANRTKVVRSDPQDSDLKEEKINGTSNEVCMDNAVVREHPDKSKVQDENNNITPTNPVKVRPKRVRGQKNKDIGTSSAQALVDSAVTTRERRACPIWLALVPLNNQYTIRNGDAAMPQTSACYLRIKDGTLPVSFVQKYLVKKYNLVEIVCRGQPVEPTLALYNLADIWLQSRPPQRVQATVGSSAKDFVMVLNYRRKFLTQ